MAKILRVEKSRKETKCSKCGQVIPVGSSYVYGTPFHRPKVVRCISCGLKSYELSGSNWVQTVGEIMEDFEKVYGYTEDGIDSVKDALEELRDTCQDSFDNMPEQLQYSENGELLESRIEQCEDALNELDSIDVDSIKSDVISNSGIVEVSAKELKEYYGDAIEINKEKVDEDGYIEIDLSDLPNNEDFDDIMELPFLDEDTKSDLRNEYESDLESAIDDALSGLEY